MLNQRQAFTCPSCGGFIGEAASVEFVSERLPKGQQTVIFNLLAKRLSRPVAKEAIVDQLFGSRSDGGPDTANRVVDVQLTHLRRNLSNFGWMIKKTGGGHGTPTFYRLVPLEAGPC